MQPRDSESTLEVTQLADGEIGIESRLAQFVVPAAAVVASLILRSGLKKAISNWSKKAVTKLVREAPSVARAAAKDLGYAPTKQTSHGKQIFKRGNKAKGPKYISPDESTHTGGAWKGASSIENLGNKKRRDGTYDINLKRIGD